MFESLSEKLSSVFKGLRKHKVLTEEIVNSALREIRIALLDADAALPAVRALIDRVKEKATGATVIGSVEPAQQIVKIVHDELISLLAGEDLDDGSDETGLILKGKKPAILMFVGLQGSGKTTSAGKLAYRLKNRHGKKVLLASLDVRRPAAREQLAMLAERADSASVSIIANEKAEEIAVRALQEATNGDYDILILDTAGRTTLDEELMQEAADIKRIASPCEILLTADGLSGQDAVNTAKAFHEKLGVTGVILTRMDGDGRGGAALSVRHVTGKPVKFIGIGEKIDAFDSFDPERVAGRILGQGDVVALVEKAAQNFDEADALSMTERFKTGKFDFNDLLSQMRMMSKMGGFGGIMSLLPGMGQIKQEMEKANFNEKSLKKQEALILSMTLKERKRPELLNASRKQRIAKGAGVKIDELNKLVSMQRGMAKMMKSIKGVAEKKKGGGLLGKLFGGGQPSEAEMAEMAAKMKDGRGMPGLDSLSSLGAGAALPNNMGRAGGFIPRIGARKKGLRGLFKMKKK